MWIASNMGRTFPVTTTKNTDTPSPENKDRRSPCPVSCTLDLIGDRWTLLVIRDLLLGRSRFKDFTASPENIPTNILSDRLERLLQNRVVEQIPVSEGSKLLGYHLTPKGQALAPIVKALANWGLKWEEDTRIGMKPQ